MSVFCCCSPLPCDIDLAFHPTYTDTLHKSFLCCFRKLIMVSIRVSWSIAAKSHKCHLVWTSFYKKPSVANVFKTKFAVSVSMLFCSKPGMETTIAVVFLSTAVAFFRSCPTPKGQTPPCRGGSVLWRLSDNSPLHAPVQEGFLWSNIRCKQAAWPVFHKMLSLAAFFASKMRVLFIMWLRKIVKYKLPVRCLHCESNFDIAYFQQQINWRCVNWNTN